MYNNSDHWSVFIQSYAIIWFLDLHIETYHASNDQRYVGFWDETSLHRKVLKDPKPFAYFFHFFPAIPPYLQMRAKKGMINSRSTLGHMRSFAENSSIHGKMIKDSALLSFCRSSLSSQQINFHSIRLVHLGDLCFSCCCLLFWRCHGQ